MAEPTKGTWELDAPREGNVKIIAREYHASKSPRTIALVPLVEKRMDETLANARYMVNAKEMYRLLCEVLEHERIQDDDWIQQASNLLERIEE